MFRDILPLLPRSTGFYLSVIYILVHIGSFFNRYSIGKLVIYVQRRSKGAQNLGQSPAIQLLHEVERCVYTGAKLVVPKPSSSQMLTFLQGNLQIIL